MRAFFFLLSLWLACKSENRKLGPTSPLHELTTLAKGLNETSGLANADDSTVYVHNDSGFKPELYQISISTGQIKQTIRIPGVPNIDWEELAADSFFIYIGDFGNNLGTRKDLVIYKVKKSKLTPGDTSRPQSIHFFYPQQLSFASGNRHNFDCEAMIAVGDSLYLFTKNRGNLATDLYRLPKTPGRFPAQYIDQFNTDGLITAADFLGGRQNSLVLLGYQIQGFRFPSFLWVFSGFHGTDFFGGTRVRLELAPDLQTEAIIFNSDSNVLITNEDETGTTGKLYKLNIGNLNQNGFYNR